MRQRQFFSVRSQFFPPFLNQQSIGFISACSCSRSTAPAFMHIIVFFSSASFNCSILLFLWLTAGCVARSMYVYLPLFSSSSSLLSVSLPLSRASFSHLLIYVEVIAIIKNTHTHTYAHILQLIDLNKCKVMIACVSRSINTHVFEYVYLQFIIQFV